MTTITLNNPYNLLIPKPTECLSDMSLPCSNKNITIVYNYCLQLYIILEKSHSRNYIKLWNRHSNTFLKLDSSYHVCILQIKPI